MPSLLETVIAGSLLLTVAAISGTTLVNGAQLQHDFQMSGAIGQQQSYVTSYISSPNTANTFHLVSGCEGEPQQLVGGLPAAHPTENSCVRVTGNKPYFSFESGGHKVWHPQTVRIEIVDPNYNDGEALVYDSSMDITYPLPDAAPTTDST